MQTGPDEQNTQNEGASSESSETPCAEQAQNPYTDSHLKPIYENKIAPVFLREEQEEKESIDDYRTTRSQPINSPQELQVFVPIVAATNPLEVLEKRIVALEQSVALLHNSLTDQNSLNKTVQKQLEGIITKLQLLESYD